MKTLHRLAAVAASLVLAQTAQAATVTDAIGDFAPGYSGAAADLDVTSFTIGYDTAANIFTLSGTMAGVIDPLSAGFYVIGVNTGSGVIAPFAGIGAPDVRFNQAVRVNKDGTALLGQTALQNATISGNAFSVAVAGTLLPGTGFAVRDYSWNLWPRVGSTVTDFSPDNGMLSAVPEPANWAMMMMGFAATGLVLRTRRQRYA